MSRRSSSAERETAPAIPVEKFDELDVGPGRRQPGGWARASIFNLAGSTDPGFAPPLRAAKIGRRVHRLGGGRYLVTVVVDPDQHDRSILYCSRRHAIRLALDTGAVIEAQLCRPTSHEDRIRENAEEMIRRGDSLFEVDEYLAHELDIAHRTARTYRAKWGMTVARKNLLDDPTSAR